MSVYFIRVGRYFKIGASEDPQRRCERLNQGSTRYTFPADVSWTEPRELYRVIAGWKSEEAMVHSALDNYAVGLEWFLDEPAVREFIDNLPEHIDRRVDLPEVPREGGFCNDEYRAVQHGRAEREIARYYAKRATALPGQTARSAARSA